MTLTVAIAICAATVPVPDCGRETATAWLIPSEQHGEYLYGLAGCERFASQFVAALPWFDPASAAYLPGGYHKTFCRFGAPPARVG